MGQKKQKRPNMKKTSKFALVAVLVSAAALLVSASLVRAEESKEKKPCCAATVEAGKKCEHECCVKAAEDGKVCAKCHPKKDKKKEEKKD